MDNDNDNIIYQDKLLEELWTDIFIRLPVKTLLILGCVCKHWRALVSDQSFQKKHLELQKKMSRNMGCFILRHYHRINEAIIHHLMDEESIASNNSPSSRASLSSRSYSVLVSGDLEFFNNYLCIEGPINGLYCVHNGEDRFVIWNPATSEAGFLPTPKCSGDASYILRVVSGFGINPLNEEDYKVLLICTYDKYGVPGNEFCRMLYTTSTNTWRVLEDGDDFVGSGNPLNYSINNTYLNGNYYVLAEDERVALAFDMGEKEAFQSISLPKFNTENTECHVDLVVHDNHINLFIVKEELCEIDIWILMVEESNWNKKISITLGLRGVMKSIGFWRTEDELILATNDFVGCPGSYLDSKTALYNTRTGEVTFVGPIGQADKFKAIFCYESLISLSSGITKYREEPASLIDKILCFLNGRYSDYTNIIGWSDVIEMKNRQN